MDIRWLEGFVVVAEELHFSNAAHRLGIAQSPLSQLIRKLEDELGQKLFERSTRSVELTAAGKALLPEARRILASMAEARELVSAAEGEIVGTVRLGFSGVLNYSTLPVLTSEVQRRLPLVELELVGQKLTQEALRMVRQGTLDITMMGCRLMIRTLKLISFTRSLSAWCCLRTIPWQALRLWIWRTCREKALLLLQSLRAQFFAIAPSNCVLQLGSFRRFLNRFQIRFWLSCWLHEGWVWPLRRRGQVHWHRRIQWLSPSNKPPCCCVTVLHG